MVTRTFVSLVVFVITGASAYAQGTPTEGPTKAELEKPSANVEAIMQQAVRNIARRYNLNEAQREKTRDIMFREVRAFLKEHEDEVWPVIREIIKSQMGWKPPSDTGQVSGLGKAARPLAELAKAKIFKANQEWRAYLTPEQKRLHDFDLAEMTQTFDRIDENLQSWSEGNPDSSPLFPPPPVVDRSPTRPRKPPTGLPDPERQIIDVSIFDIFVEEFIKEYHLDEGQIDSARSILAEYKGKAEKFKETHKEEFARITREQRAAIDKGERKAIASTVASHKKLMKPFHESFASMHVRLQGLLRTAQIDKYGPNSESRTVKASSKASPKRKQTTANKEEAPAEVVPEKPVATDGTDDQG